MELSSLHSQRAQGDTHTLSLSVHWSQQVGEKRRDVLGREITFICFLHAETRGTTWQMTVEGNRAQLMSSGAETTSKRIVEKSLHFLAMATRRAKTHASLCPCLLAVLSKVLEVFTQSKCSTGQEAASRHRFASSCAAPTGQSRINHTCSCQHLSWYEAAVGYNCACSPACFDKLTARSCAPSLKQGKHSKFHLT